MMEQDAAPKGYTFHDPSLARLAQLATRLEALMKGEGEEGGDTDAALESGVGAFFDKTIGGKGGAPAAADDDDDAEGEGEEEEGEEEEGEEGEEEEEEGEEEEGEEGEEEEEEGEEEEEEEEDSELDPHFKSAAERHRLPTRFEDIVRTLPKEQQAKARTAFGTRLKEMESGLNRAFQATRKDRRELATVKAEKEYIEANPIDFFVELFEKDPKFADKLNAELEKLETEAYRDAKKMRREDAKKDVTRKAEEKAKAEEAAEAKREERITHVTRVARTANKEYGVPFRLIERALYVAITTSDTGDLTDAQIRRVVTDEGKAYRKETGQRKRDDRKTIVKDKAAERSAARRRPTGRDRGHSPAPGRVRPPRNLEEALTRSAARIIPDLPG